MDEIVIYEILGGRVNTFILSCVVASMFVVPVAIPMIKNKKIAAIIGAIAVCSVMLVALFIVIRVVLYFLGML